VKLRLSDRDAHLLTLAALVVLGTVGVMIARRQTERILELRTRLHTQLDVLEREHDLLRHWKPKTRAQALEQLLGVSTVLLLARTPAEAQAQLAQRIDSVAEASVVNVTRLEPLPTKRSNSGIVEVPIRLEAESDLVGALGFLAGLEHSVEQVRFDAFSVEARSEASGKRPTKAQAEILRLTTTIVGYLAALPAGLRDQDASARRSDIKRTEVARLNSFSGSLQSALVASIVEHNPFRPERAPANARYRIAGTAPEPDQEKVSEKLPVPAIKLAGVIAGRSGKGMAALELEGHAARILSIGDTIGGFRLLSVNSGAARLARMDTTITLTIR
jgi:hypothetical protein